MMTEVVVWLGCLLLLPLGVVAASFSNLKVEGLRKLTVACAGALLMISILTFAIPALYVFEITLGGVRGGLWGDSLLRLNEISSVLVPFAASLWLLTVAVTPRGQLDRAGLRRTALSTVVTIYSFLTVSPGLLALLWLASCVILLAALSDQERWRARRVAAIYLGGATSLLVIGVLLVAQQGDETTLYQQIGLGMIVLAALIRKAIFPFHAWVPEVFERGRLGPAVLFSAPQVGAYVASVLVVPYAVPAVLRLVALLSLVTAVYGALLALVQVDARRACGYLFVSQSALVMAGLHCPNHEALTGSLVLWVSSGIAFAGLGRCVLVIEARRGRLNLSRYHGGYERMPVLAVTFLLMGLACTGFPGTLGFIGEEMLVEGAIEALPGVGFFVVVASALTGLAVLRMYFSLFCGRRDTELHLAVLPREGLVFAAIAIFLVGAGLAPRPLLRLLTSSSDTILQLRQGMRRHPETRKPPRSEARSGRREPESA